MNGAKLSWQVGFPRALYWVQSWLISSTTIWTTGIKCILSKFADNSQLGGSAGKALWKALHMLDVWAEDNSMRFTKVLSSALESE